MTVSLELLTAAPTLDQIRTKLLSYWQAREIQITDWEPGAFMRTLKEYVALALEDVLGGVIPAIVAGGFPVATGLAGAEDWAELVAEQWFDRARIAATFATQTVVLTCGAGNGPYTITAGTLIVRNPRTGNRYFSATGGTLNTSSTLTITVRAEMSNDSLAGRNYVDTANTLTELVTPLAGVTVNNPAPSFSAVRTTPSPTSGKGVVTVSGTPATNPTTYDVAVAESGQRAAAEIQTRVNGGAWTAPVTMGATFTFSGGPTVNFTDDPGLTDPSFVVGEIYSFTSPGSPITSPGLDRETITALLKRALERWPSLEPGAVPDKRDRWAREASALVTRVRVIVKGEAFPGRTDVVIAGVSNPLGSPVVDAVQDYINRRSEIGERDQVVAATTTTVTVGGHVNVRRGQLQAVQAAAQAAWNAYVLGTDIGGVVRLSELVEALMAAGVLDVGAPAGGALTINSFGVNLQLDPGKVAVPAAITSLTWNQI
jgi:hypothetical protein